MKKLISLPIEVVEEIKRYGLQYGLNFSEAIQYIYEENKVLKERIRKLKERFGDEGTE